MGEKNAMEKTIGVFMSLASDLNVLHFLIKDQKMILSFVCMLYFWISQYLHGEQINLSTDLSLGWVSHGWVGQVSE